MPTLLSDGVTDYITGPDGLPVEHLTTGGTPTYYLTDHAGNTRALLNHAGTVTGTYTPYGTVTTTGNPTTPLQYGRGYTDTETGLVYLINRYYDPATAQFTSTDPLISPAPTR